MPLLLRTHYQLATNSLRQNRARSFLTCLGISIGVASIILILSLMGSITNLINSQIKSIGKDLIVVRPATHKDAVTNVVDELTSANQYRGSNLTLQDAKTIKKISGVAATAPIAISHNTLQTKRTNSDSKTIKSAPVLATTPDFLKIHPLPIKTGAFFDKKMPENSAVIGRTLSLHLFGNTSSVGKTVSMLGQHFIITGVLSQIEDPINFNNLDYANALIINADFLATFSQNIQIQQINVKTTTIDNLSPVSKAISQKLVTAKSGDTNFTVASGDQISHPAGSLFSIISGMLTLVACISLIVGGIGVMNIMLVSVSERTREIGIRKAVGASNDHIFLQFLFEALVLSLLGGLLGLILGYLIAFIISTFTPFAPFISLGILFITILTSLVIGTLFGLYPAFKAARKDPIDSLKSYR